MVQDKINLDEYILELEERISKIKRGEGKLCTLEEMEELLFGKQ